MTDVRVYEREDPTMPQQARSAVLTPHWYSRYVIVYGDRGHSWWELPGSWRSRPDAEAEVRRIWGRTRIGARV